MRERPARPNINRSILTKVNRSFLLAYLGAFNKIEGWFHYDAALMFMAYNQQLRACGVVGHVVEIGVHHGLSTIATAALRGPGKRVYAVDLFDRRQLENVSGSGRGNRSTFERNMRVFYPDLDFLRIIEGASSELSPRELGADFSFCHIDGGHSREETYHDLRLCHEITLPGALIAIDDYFNPAFPGVSEGAVTFMLDHPGALKPVAIGYAKVLYQKLPAPGDLNAAFRRAFPQVEHQIAQMADTPAILFTSVLRSYLDLHASTPDCFVPLGAAGTRAELRPRERTLRAKPGAVVALPVSVTNTSTETFPAGKGVFGLSYHLLSASGQVLRHDNDRTWLRTALEPGGADTFELRVAVPEARGRYRLDIDLVWEQVMWFHDIGNPTASVDVLVG